ncbi:MAG: riboflavin synthase [Flavobacteriaceae bacterium]|jgi:riboflavin synthase|nr:riboflavin synthase [Flavobacteriaceae bacterium]|tara:strand:- start:2085 stop:2675 length:591 start_codon:yes stop_codon:yes gene_type:complete
MFTGIIENLGKVKSITKKESNINFQIQSTLTNQLKVDQSISHNGVCLTVTKINSNNYEVTAIEETIKKTNLGNLNIGSVINLERAMKIDQLLDGHIVQGHIDQTGECSQVKTQNGSWIYTFEYDNSKKNITIEKGSIAVNGVSLTVLDSKKSSFSVAIIPHTYKNTNFHKIIKGEIVNLEFDVLGKYIAKMYDIYK